MALPQQEEKDEMQGAVAAFWCLYRFGADPASETYRSPFRAEIGAIAAF